MSKETNPRSPYGRWLLLSFFSKEKIEIIECLISLGFKFDELIPHTQEVPEGFQYHIGISYSMGYKSRFLNKTIGIEIAKQGFTQFELGKHRSLNGLINKLRKLTHRKNLPSIKWKDIFKSNNLVEQKDKSMNNILPTIQLSEEFASELNLIRTEIESITAKIESLETQIVIANEVNDSILAELNDCITDFNKYKNATKVLCKELTSSSLFPSQEIIELGLM